MKQTLFLMALISLNIISCNDKDNVGPGTPTPAPTYESYLTDEPWYINGYWLSFKDSVDFGEDEFAKYIAECTKDNKFVYTLDSSYLELDLGSRCMNLNDTTFSTWYINLDRDSLFHINESGFKSSSFIDVINDDSLLYTINTPFNRLIRVYFSHTIR